MTAADLIPLKYQREKNMNRKRIAKEWLIFLPAALVGLIIIPVVLTMIHEGGFYYSDWFYQHLFRAHSDKFGGHWLIVLSPYLIIQSVRLTIWAIKQVREK